jgi:hypothetical protein
MQLLGKIRLLQEIPNNNTININNKKYEFSIQTIFKYSSIKLLQQEILTNNDNNTNNTDNNKSVIIFPKIISNSNIISGRASYAQQRIYLHDILYKNNNNDENKQASILYNIPHIYQINNINDKCMQLDINKLQLCFISLINRHSTLRTLFQWNDLNNELQQFILDMKQIDFKLNINLNCKGIDELNNSIQQIVTHRFNLNLDTNNKSLLYKPLIIVGLFAINNNNIDSNTNNNIDSNNCTILLSSYSSIILTYTIHHIAFDGYSSPIFNRELLQLYENQCNLQCFNKLPCSYLDYSLYEYENLNNSNNIWKNSLNYWQQHIKPLLNEEDQQDLINADEKLDNEKYLPITINLSTHIVQYMKQFIFENKLSLFQLFVGLYILLLNRLTGRSVISIGNVIYIYYTICCLFICLFGFKYIFYLCIYVFIYLFICQLPSKLTKFILYDIHNILYYMLYFLYCI